MNARAQSVDFIPSQVNFALNHPKWNSNEEVASILCSARDHPEWFISEASIFPPSTSQKLFHRFDGVYFKQDGYVWKKRKEGKLIREDHVKLKVKKVEMIAGNYVHSAIVPTFHRRTYWLIHHPDIILVHYLNVASEGISDCQPIHVKIFHSIRSSRLHLTATLIEKQIRSILCYSLSRDELENTIANVFELLIPPSETFLLSNIKQTSGIEEDHHTSSKRKRITVGKSSSLNFPHRPAIYVVRRHPSCDSITADVEFSNFDANNWQTQAMNSAQTTGIFEENQSIVFADVDHSDRTIGSIEADRRKTNRLSEETEIIDFSPDKCSIKGGTKILIVGGWYSHYRNYAVKFSEKMVPAKLFQAGVLRCFAPPQDEIGFYTMQVYCNGKPLSNTIRIEYCNNVPHENSIKMQLAKRFSLIQSCICVEQTDTTKKYELPVNFLEEDLLEGCRQLMLQPLNNTMLTKLSETCTVGSTLLHLCSILNFSRVIRLIFQWRSQISFLHYARDFDVVAKDDNGHTAIHLAVFHSSIQCIEALLIYFPPLVNVTDDQGNTAYDWVVKSNDVQVLEIFSKYIYTPLDSAACVKLQQTKADSSDNLNSTALWVLTNGGTITNKQRVCRLDQRFPMLQNGFSFDSTNFSSGFSDVESLPSAVSAQSSHLGLNVNDNTNNWLNDALSFDSSLTTSPLTSEVWNNMDVSKYYQSEDGNKRMAYLAQQIIDALPSRIKTETRIDMDYVSDKEINDINQGTDCYQSGLSDHSKNPFLLSAYSHSSDEWTDPQSLTHEKFSQSTLLEEDNSNFSTMNFDHNDLDLERNSFQSPSNMLFSEDLMPSTSTKNIETTNTSTKDLGNFFNSESYEPIEQHFQNLRLSDREQRELYEAAKIIQHAYRQYKARISTQRQYEAERNAAVLIQSYYRRYKQFCYFKKLHKAAVLIQKHFRMHKAVQKSTANEGKPVHRAVCSSFTVPEFHSNDTTMIRENRAALTIQHAYRGHYQRKRQAAARKIQKFMQQSKHKLRKIHELNGADCTVFNRKASQLIG